MSGRARSSYSVFTSRFERLEDSKVRFRCDSCQRVYVVSQELSGRAFRMKCKTCGATISVRPGAETPVTGQSHPVVRAAPPPPPPPPPSPARQAPILPALAPVAAPPETRRAVVVEPLRREAPRREAAPVQRAQPSRQSANAWKMEPDLSPAARAIPTLVPAVPAVVPAVVPVAPPPAPAPVAAEPRSPRPPRDGGRGEVAAAREVEPPSPRHRRRTVPRRASLVPTFVLSAILALVVAASVYFSRDPVPDVRRDQVERLAGKPSAPARGD